VLEATPTLQGLNDTTLEDAGPWFPAACTTRTPAFRANNKEMSNMFKKVKVSCGGSFGPTDRDKISTPSRTACANHANFFSSYGHSHYYRHPIRDKTLRDQH